jgi:CRISPR-associated protein Csm1
MRECNMTEFDKREYQTIVLAALLHDIGKFLHRVTEIKELSGTHQDLGADFVSGKGVFSESGKHSQLHVFSKMIQDDWVDKDKLEQCIRKHHSGYRYWGWIVHKADSYSTKERFTEGEGVTTYPPRGSMIPLKPVFASVNFEESTSAQVFGYDATILDSFRSFPTKQKDKLDYKETFHLFEKFIKHELLRINLEKPTFDKFYNTLHSIFEKYLWSLPCHTHPAIADVSIFDHLKSSSAIAACLYQYHSLSNTLTVKDIRIDDEKKFLLVGGELSGIQKYVYQISAITGEGGVAKRLRARSFFISALMEVTVTKILRELNLPVSCNLLSAGGKFILLVPNVQEIKERLDDLYYEISAWFLKEFSGELSLTMDWSTSLTGSDFCKKKDKASSESLSVEEGEEPEEEDDPENHRECNFRDRLDALWFALERKKLTRFKNVLYGNSIWHENKFLMHGKYLSYGKGIGDCRSCKKFPAEFKDPHSHNNSEKVLCTQCVIDKVIGRKLLDAEYLAIGQDVNEERLKTERSLAPIDWDSFFFFDDHYFITILKDRKNLQWADDFIVVEKLRDHKDEMQPVVVGSVHRFLANYTPSFKDYTQAESLCNVCKEPRPCEQIKIMKESVSKKHLYTFSCIAAASSELTDIPEEYRGNQLIGVLKADVDNLGLIFSEGLKNWVTISRYLTMSRMFDLFFSGWMYRILKDTDEYREIYTVYSGGDDLVLVGPWERIINFARRLNQEFTRFTCNNENITLSAGIAVVHPKHPISDAVDEADTYLEKSKNAGKNRITFFDTTIKWSELDPLLAYKDTLNKGHRYFGDILTTQFIHRLLTYHQMYLDSKNGNLAKLIFHSHMYYDVRRNLKQRISDLKDKKKLNAKDKQRLKWFEDNILRIMLKLYQTSVDAELMENLKIPVYWTLYKNRKYRIRR